MKYIELQFRLFKTWIYTRMTVREELTKKLEIQYKPKE